MTEGSFASRSVPVHLVRGVAGFGLVALSIASIQVVGLFGLLLLPVGVVALRGCPTCWAIGLAQTISRGRLERSCVDGYCRLTSRSAMAEPVSDTRVAPAHPHH